MPTAGSAKVDWTEQPHSIGPMGNIVFGPQTYQPRRCTALSGSLLPCDCWSCKRHHELNDEILEAIKPAPKKMDAGLAARISSAICKLDALRAELAAIKAAL